MKARIQAKYNEATELYGRARGILDEYEKTEMPAEKVTEVDKLFEAFDAKIAEAKRLEAAASREMQVNEIEQPQNALNTPKAAPAQSSDDTDEAALARKAWGRALKGGTRVLSGSELKALRADNDPSGGYLVAPTQVVKELIKFVDDMVFIRTLATVYPLAMAESLGVPSLDTDLSDPEWTSELQTGNEDTVEPFGARELKPSPLAKRIKLSKKLLRQATINVENLVRDRLGYKFGVSQEKGFLTGTGVGQPLGVFTASPMGIDTSRDVTAAAATTFNGNDFIDLKHALKGQYWPRARIIVHRTTISAVRKLKDSNQNYIWSPGLGPGGGLTGGLPQTIVDVPYLVSEFVPNTVTSGLYTAIIGDFSHYWIAEALNLEIQVVMELYAETNQIGYIGRMEVDGMPVLAEAFARLRMA